MTAVEAHRSEELDRHPLVDESPTTHRPGDLLSDVLGIADRIRIDRRIQLDDLSCRHSILGPVLQATY